jgi:hypothetical protein
MSEPGFGGFEGLGGKKGNNLILLILRFGDIGIEDVEVGNGHFLALGTL